MVYQIVLSLYYLHMMIDNDSMIDSSFYFFDVFHFFYIRPITMSQRASSPMVSLIPVIRNIML